MKDAKLTLPNPLTFNLNHFEVHHFVFKETSAETNRYSNCPYNSYKA